MGKLTKILAPIVAFFAVLVCAACVLGYYEFKKYKARAVKLATSIVKNTQVLDEKSNSGAPEKVTFTPGSKGVKEQGTLSYPANRKSTAELDEALQVTDDLTQKVVEQRNAMAKTLESLSIALKNNQVKQGDLYKLDAYQPKLQLAENYAKTAYATCDEFAKAIETFGSLLAKSRPYAGKVKINRTIAIKDNTATKPNNNGNYATLNKALNELLNQKNQYELALKSLQQIITEFKFTSQPQKINFDNHATTITKLRNDLRGINEKLKELKRTQAQLRAVQNENSQLKKQVADLKAENKKLQQEIEALKQERKQLNEATKETPEKKTKVPLTQVDPNVVGKTLVYNKTWNFVICNLGSEKIITGVEVMISSGDQPLASGIVSTVEETISIIELNWSSGKEIPVGAKVFIKPQKN